MNKVHFHRRNLPHFYRTNSTYFITYRLKDSIPISKINELRNRNEFNRDFKTKEEKYHSYEKYFEEYDKLLDNNRKKRYLSNPKVAEVVRKSLHYYDHREYKLICYTIMPNHVHLVFHLLENTQTGMSVLQDKDVTQSFKAERNSEQERISKIMQSIKGYSSREANIILNRKGSFWQSESYDHIVRDENELEKIIKYVIYNPVKVNLVEKWEDWKYSYLADE